MSNASSPSGSRSPNRLPPAFFALLLLWLPAARGIPAAAAATLRLRPLTIYIVRHAEKVNNRDDSPLTRRGQQYAQRLAVLLQNRGIDRILTSDLKRARDTALPLERTLRARGRRVAQENLSSDDASTIAKTILRIRRGGVLLVGRSSFIPELVRNLSGRDISQERNYYYRVYVLVRRSGRPYPFVFKEGPAWTPSPGAHSALPLRQPMQSMQPRQPISASPLDRMPMKRAAPGRMPMKRAPLNRMPRRPAPRSAG